MVSAKNPAKVRAGQIGARARWGEQRVLRLDQLGADERRLVAALLAAKHTADEAKKDATATNGDAPEVTSVGSSPTS